MSPGPQSLPALLAGSAARFGDRPALAGTGVELSYRALDTAVTRLAADFAGTLAPGERVGLAVRPGVLPLTLSAALMRAGCTYVPLDVRQPASRLRLIADGSGMRTAVCDPACAAGVRAAGVTPMVVDLDDVRHAAAAPPLAGGAVAGPEVVPVPAHGGYAMFTSGSSGTPKGVEVTPANVMALLADALPLFGYRDDEAWPLVHGYGFDVSVWEMWAGVAVGARLFALDEAVVVSPPKLAEALARERATRLHIVPSVFRHLADAAAARGGALPLRGVVFCGEALDYQAIRTWTQGVPGPAPQFVNVYGITETTVYNTFHVVTPGEIREPPAAAPIGRGYRRSPAVVIGPDGRLAKPGEIGEIHIGGAQVSPGYLNNPELTRERFGSLPALPGRWYRTGDLGSTGPNGVLSCRGRADDQVKVRGFRIELGEIDSALRRVPWLRAGAAVLDTSARGEPVITACVVAAPDAPDIPEPGNGTALSALRTTLARFVPEHMLPNSVVFLERLPQNANGKTDRRALAETARSRRAAPPP